MELNTSPQPNEDQNFIEDGEYSDVERVQTILSKLTDEEREELVYYLTWFNYRKEASMMRRRFTPDEDDKLKYIIKQMTSKNKKISWNIVSQLMGERFSPRQCKERWTKYLSPEVSLNEWTREEDELLFKLFNKHGAKWTKIAPFFRRRTNVDVKNRWLTLVRRSEKEKQRLIHVLLEE